MYALADDWYTPAPPYDDEPPYADFSSDTEMGVTEESLKLNHLPVDMSLMYA